MITNWIIWVVNFRSHFMKFVLRISGGINFWDPVEDSDTSCLSSINVRMEYLFAFQFLYCELCVKNWRKWGRKFFGGALIVDGWGVMRWDTKSYLGPVEIASFSSRDFSWSNKHDTFYFLTCCIDWMFLRFIFMKHWCFRFSFLGNL